MAEIGAWHDKHSSSGKLADSRHQLDWPDKAKTARASEVTSSRAVVVMGGWPIVRLVERTTDVTLKEDRNDCVSQAEPDP
jgi:hypothetical protein